MDLEKAMIRNLSYHRMKKQPSGFHIDATYEGDRLTSMTITHAGVTVPLRRGMDFTTTCDGGRVHLRDVIPKLWGEPHDHVPR